MVFFLFALHAAFAAVDDGRVNSTIWEQFVGDFRTNSIKMRPWNCKTKKKKTYNNYTKCLKRNQLIKTRHVILVRRINSN